MTGSPPLSPPRPREWRAVVDEHQTIDATGHASPISRLAYQNSPDPGTRVRRVHHRATPPSASRPPAPSRRRPTTRAVANGQGARLPPSGNRLRVFLLLVFLVAFQLRQLQIAGTTFRPGSEDEEGGPNPAVYYRRSTRSSQTAPTAGAGEAMNATNAAAATIIPPSRMKVKYHKMWDHDTSRIRVPEEFRYPFGTRHKETSLEILERVLHGEEHRKEYAAVDEYVARVAHAGGGGSASSTDDIPKCLLPDTQNTRRFADRVVRQRQQRALQPNGAPPLPLPPLLQQPVLNVGFPKCGSSTLSHYFECAGYVQTDNKWEGKNTGERMWNLVERGLSPFVISDGDGGIRARRQVQAFMQLDHNRGPGYYPQISLLDEMHEFEPNSTLVLTFRPVLDWIDSAGRWGNKSKGGTLAKRMARFDVPGLVLAPEHRQTSPREKRAFADEDQMRSRLARWWCAHVNHVREYARAYPSHALVELDLYDANGTSRVLYDLFERNGNGDGGNGGSGNGDEMEMVPSSCWGHTTPVRRSYETKKKNKPK